MYIYAYHFIDIIYVWIVKNNLQNHFMKIRTSCFFVVDAIFKHLRSGYLGDKLGIESMMVEMIGNGLLID